MQTVKKKIQNQFSTAADYVLSKVFTIRGLSIKANKNLFSQSGVLVLKPIKTLLFKTEVRKLQKCLFLIARICQTRAN